MRSRNPLVLTLTLTVALAGCANDGGEELTAPRPAGATDVHVSHDAGGAVVASAEGGGNWTLIIEGFPPIDQVLGFNATKFRDGSVRGHIEYHQRFGGETFRFEARVTCMSVYDGNRVKYGGEITGSNTDVAPGTFIWFQGIDGGEGSGGGPDLSTGSGFGTAAENQAFCDSPAPPNPIFLAEIDGDIQVDD